MISQSKYQAEQPGKASVNFSRNDGHKQGASKQKSKVLYLAADAARGYKHQKYLCSWILIMFMDLTLQNIKK